MAPIVGYWDFRGQAAPIRYLLHYAGVEFEDKRYTTDEEWLNDKFQLGLDFPNLPYYIDDKVKLTHSLTILRYLARKHKLAGSNVEEQTRNSLVEQHINDLRVMLESAVFSTKSNLEKKKEDILKYILPCVKMLSDFLGESRWITGESITYVDFFAYEALDHYWLLFPSVLKDFPNLKNYIERFEEIPALKNYMKSESYKRWPIYPSMANLGSSGEEPKREEIW